MDLLQSKYPDAFFFVTGASGPKSGGHAQDERVYMPYVEKISGCVAHLLHNLCKPVV